MDNHGKVSWGRMKFVGLLALLPMLAVVFPAHADDRPIIASRSVPKPVDAGRATAPAPGASDAQIASGLLLFAGAPRSRDPLPRRADFSLINGPPVPVFRGDH